MILILIFVLFTYHFKNQLNHFSDKLYNLSAKSNNVSTFGDYSYEHAISSDFPWID